MIIRLIIHKQFWKTRTSLVGFEPTAFGLEVQRAIHCATGTQKRKLFTEINKLIAKQIVNPNIAKW